MGDPTAITLENASKVQIARAEYDTLTDSQKKLVTKYNTLSLAESQLVALDKAVKEKEQQESSASTANGKLKVHFIDV